MSIEAPLPEAFASPEEEGRRVLETYHFPELGYTVEAVAPDDVRIDAARDIEAKCFAALGDPEEEVRAEMAPYNDHSMYYLAFETGSNGDAADIAGMGRVIPFTPEHPNKTLTDLAVIPGWDAEGIAPATTLNQGGEVVEGRSVDDIIEAFFAESGCDDLRKVWDITSMAPNMDKVMQGMNPRGVAKSILGAASEAGIRAWRRGELTHVTSFNQEHAHGYFLKKGFPFKPLFGLDPVKYDSFGSEQGMVAQPAWFDLNTFAQRLQAAQPEDYLGILAADLYATHDLEREEPEALPAEAA